MHAQSHSTTAGMQQAPAARRSSFHEALDRFYRETAAEDRAPHPISGEGEAACREDSFSNAMHLFQGTMVVSGLAYYIADEAARSDIELYTVEVGDHWFDTNQVRYGLERQFIDRAMQYLELRGSMRRHPDQPHLVTFAGVG